MGLMALLLERLQLWLLIFRLKVVASAVIGVVVYVFIGWNSSSGGSEIAYYEQAVGGWKMEGGLHLSVSANTTAATTRKPDYMLDKYVSATPRLS